MAKTTTPPTSSCSRCGGKSIYWIDKEPTSKSYLNWIIDGKDSKISSRGVPGLTPTLNETTKTWFIGDTDTGISYLTEITLAAYVEHVLIPDITSVITPDASDEAEAISLVNELKGKVNEVVLFVNELKLKVNSSLGTEEVAELREVE